MPYNEKSRANLIPFKNGEDRRRQIGRKKGSLNQRTVIKTILSEPMSPNMIFSPATRERLYNMRDKTYLEAITMTLVNQSLNGNHQASNILLRELRKAEEAEPKKSEIDEMRDIRITVVDSREEYERLEALRDSIDEEE